MGDAEDEIKCPQCSYDRANLHVDRKDIQPWICSCPKCGYYEYLVWVNEKKIRGRNIL